jgi:hypothetical protein
VAPEKTKAHEGEPRFMNPMVGGVGFDPTTIALKIPFFRILSDQPTLLICTELSSPLTFQ